MPRSFRRANLLSFLFLTPLLCGCVERVLVIKTTPEGANVILDREEKGKTPAGIEFVHYGVRELVIEKKGYDPVVTNVKLSRPWYQVFPIDFITEVLWPWTIHNTHTVEYTLNETKSDDKGLKERAEGFRIDARKVLDKPDPVEEE